MLNEKPTKALVVRLATQNDIDTITYLDSFSTSPIRDLHRDMQKYFGSVDPSTHERTLIFLGEINGAVVAKAELMLPTTPLSPPVGYIKRVVVHPHFRGQGVAKQLMQHVIQAAQNEYHLQAIDLHVWEDNTAAIRLYEDLGFQLRHRELYYRLNL